MHPIDLGADMCCDSAHKTLSALTGCAYLHVSHSAPAIFKEKARSAMMLFASTSPSYLMLDSLDRLNASLSSGYKERLSIFIKKIEGLKSRLIEGGYSFVGDEPMKLTLEAKKYGYYGTEISDYLLDRGIYTEFSDPDYLVLMPSPENSDEDLDRLFDALSALPRQEREFKSVPKAHASKKCTSIRDAVMADSERLPISECLGRVAATVTLACPPAIPIAICGEKITKEHLKVFQYYGVEKLSVKK